MKRFKYRPNRVPFRWLYVGAREHVWSGDGSTLRPGKDAGVGGDVTYVDIASELGRLGEPILNASLATPWGPGAYWLKDAARIADAVGSINRRPTLESDLDMTPRASLLTGKPIRLPRAEDQPPIEEPDSIWQWARLSLHLAAGLRARQMIQDLESLVPLREAIEGAHGAVAQEFPRGHPIRASSDWFPENPWAIYLSALGQARYSAMAVGTVKERVVLHLRSILGYQLARQYLFELRPELPVAIGATPQALATYQLLRLWSDDCRPMKECSHCGAPYAVHDGRQIYCSSRCNRAAYRLRKTKSPLG